MRKITFYLFVLTIACLLVCCSGKQQTRDAPDEMKFISIKDVAISDSFWGPKFKQWGNITANDVFDKFEGKFKKNPEEWDRNNSFINFDDVANRRTATGHHAGLPWFDGLIYETIRGVSDLLAQNPDKEMESRIDAYIDRISAAQKSDPDGYVDTWTQLIEPGHRWGDNGGFLRWQHDVYNAGMLIEAGIHYYESTGKTKLLETATRFANHMAELMGPAPKRNIVPSHSGPEEPMMKLYRLYKNNPELKSQIDMPVNEEAYYELTKFWIENRGNHCGYPHWLAWGNEKSEQWIRDQKYKDPSFGEWTRPSWGDYAQDSISVFEQKTIEGHAVRATLLATGIATVALENHSPEYIRTVKDLWDNMVGKRMFVTGGVGAIHHDEKFGPDYFLPTDAYLETCAAVGAGFFSQRMNELTGDARYMDEFERVLYNNVLTGISLSGKEYSYQNPLNSHNHSRWDWHDCPCCPPMFLKMVSAVPGYIFSYQADNIFINLFIGSTTKINIANNQVQITQKTNYPWEGLISIQVDPQKESLFAVQIRVPGWAQGKENPYDLYSSNLESDITLSVNGSDENLNIEYGYAVIRRNWKKGDKIELKLPMHPRLITANEQVKDLDGLVTLASGPFIYCLESVDNSDLENLQLDKDSPLEVEYRADLLGGINVIRGFAINGGKVIAITAIPYYAVGNRQKAGYKVWIPEKD